MMTLLQAASAYRPLPLVRSDGGRGLPPPPAGQPEVPVPDLEQSVKNLRHLVDEFLVPNLRLLQMILNNVSEVDAREVCCR